MSHAVFRRVCAACGGGRVLGVGDMRRARRRRGACRHRSIPVNDPRSVHWQPLAATAASCEFNPHFNYYNCAHQKIITCTGHIHALVIYEDRYKSYIIRITVNGWNLYLRYILDFFQKLVLINYIVGTLKY